MKPISTKTIFIDLDGTLMNDEKEITSETSAAVIRAKAAGHEIIISSGRSFPYVAYRNGQIGNVCRYAVTSTGSMVYDFVEKEILAINPIPTEAVSELLHFDHPNISWHFHCSDGLFANVEGDKGVSILTTQPLDEFQKTKTVVAICIAGYDFDLMKSLEANILKVPGVHITNRHKALVDESFPKHGIYYYDITAEGVSKGIGVSALQKHLNLDPANCIAIGDDNNDIAMFVQCGTKVAMGNSIPTVKQVADIIIDDNNADGVAKFLDTLK